MGARAAKPRAKGVGFLSYEQKMAERKGFEPPLPFPVDLISNQAPSATRPPLQRVQAIEIPALKIYRHLDPCFKLSRRVQIGCIWTGV